MRAGVDYVGVSIVYFCHDGKGNFLMQKRGSRCRDENGKWDIGAGQLDPHLTVEQTLRKEISEEYNASVISYEFLGHREVFRQNRSEKTHWIALDHLVLINPEKVENREPHKFDEIGWFTLDSLPSPLHSQLPFF